jgi:AraC-like DNA-binding protein
VVTSYSETNTEEVNLALMPGVSILVSMVAPIGGGARDPKILLNNLAHQLDGHPLSDFDQSRTYDTYHGQNQVDGIDWYALEFPESTAFNCIEMTMGLFYPDGGWWKTLAVEVIKNRGDAWQPVDYFNITPAYNFNDVPYGRKPYETYALTFAEVSAVSVRIIGQVGGMARFTSLARLAIYQRDLSRWNPARLSTPPVPYIFQLVPPQMIWDLSENLTKLTGLAIKFPFMKQYLDQNRYEQYQNRIKRNYHGEPDLWFLIGDTVGWDLWKSATQIPQKAPFVRVRFNDVLAQAVAPIVVNDEILGEMTTYDVIIRERLNLEWHRQFADEHGIPWGKYEYAIECSHQMTLEQLEGAAGLMGQIANSIASLAHRNQYLENELKGSRESVGQRALYKKEIVRRAVDYMQDKLETDVTVANVANFVSLSVPYFCTLFTEQTGQNPGNFLIELRLERAKEYLTHTQMSVMEICVALGYDPSYFSRLFKRHVGCTPGTYARKLRSDSINRPISPM